MNYCNLLTNYRTVYNWNVWFSKDQNGDLMHKIGAVIGLPDVIQFSFQCVFATVTENIVALPSALVQASWIWKLMVQ